MGNIKTNGLSNPVSGLANAPLMAARAEVAGFAREGEEFFVSAIGTKDAGESGGEVAATVELVDDIDGVGAQWTVGFPVSGFVVALKFAP
jgi:hypothetical protein